MTNVSIPTARYSQTNTNTPPPLLFVLISTPGLSLDLTLDLNKTTVCSGSAQTRTYTSTSRQRSSVPIVHLSLAPPSCSISGLDWTSQGPGASPPSVWLIPSLHHLFPSLASDTCVKGNTAAWWIGLFMDASLPGRLLILQSAPVYLLFTQASAIHPRSERHLTPIERSMSGPGYWKLEF